MSKCPHCGNELKLADYVYNNVETYGRLALASTECCGHGVYVSRQVSFGINKYLGDRTEDDWGDDIKPLENKSSSDELKYRLVVTAFTHFQCNQLTEGFDVIRKIENPLTAAWVVQRVIEEMGSSMTQTKNWLINALYNGK